METLSKEKSEIDEKLRTQEEGQLKPPQASLQCFVLTSGFLFVVYIPSNVSFVSPLWLAEYLAQKEEITNTLKANYEKGP